MEEKAVLVKSEFNKSTGRYDLILNVPTNNVSIDYNDMLSLLVGGVSLLIKAVSKLDTDTKDYQVLETVIKKLQDDFASTTNYSDGEIMSDNRVPEEINYASNVVLLNEDGYVLAVSRKDNHEDFGIIGGKSEPIDENNPKATAIREALEETGLTISDLKLVFYKIIDGVHNFTYLANYTGDISYTENHVVKWLPFNELFKGTFGEHNKILYDNLVRLGIDNIKINK